MSDDDFIADRIRWRASKHELPAGQTHYFDDAPEQVRGAIDDARGDYDLGTAVVVFGKRPRRWTVFGTRGAISHHNRTLHSCAFARIAEFDMGPPYDVAKHKLEYLKVVLTDSSIVRLWAPRGSQFFAMWSILLMLSRMNLDDEHKTSLDEMGP